MKIEDRAKDYSKGFWLDRENAEEDFTQGAQWTIAEIELFLLANPKATAKQIVEYLKTL